MGRGRAKAKQTKVARRLKYSGPDTDLQALENELRGSEPDELDGDAVSHDDDFDHDDDPYARYVDDDDR